MEFPTLRAVLLQVGDGALSYNVDTTQDLPAVEQDVHEYQPEFPNSNADDQMGRPGPASR